MPVDLQQHDLSPTAARAVVGEAGLFPGGAVLEIGPGLGALTHEMLAAGAVVHAIERDPRRVAHLRERFAAAIASGALTVIAGDALRLRPRLADGWRVLANPPFTLTAQLLRSWLLEPWPGGPPAALDLVLQREAAGKLGGSPANETRTSVLVRLAGTPRIAGTFRRDDVTPPSRVDLVHWSFVRRADAPAPAELAVIDRLLAAAFAGPHTVRDALRGVATPVQIKRQAKERGWNPEGHSRVLRPEDWRALAAVLVKTGQL